MARLNALMPLALLALSACAPTAEPTLVLPTEIIDLGTLVTPDLPEKHFGRGLLAIMATMGLERQNELRVVPWTLGAISGQNSYYTLFNHGGPHVDAPIHVGFSEGLDGYAIESFAGPVEVFDVRGQEPGWTVGRETFEGRVEPGDVVLLYTGYQPPLGDELPTMITLTRDAAEYLAGLPVRAFGTDAPSVDCQGDAVFDSPRTSCS